MMNHPAKNAELTGIGELRTAKTLKTHIKSNLVVEKKDPGDEQISMSSFSEKWRKESEGFLNILIIFYKVFGSQTRINFGSD